MIDVSSTTPPSLASSVLGREIRELEILGAIPWIDGAAVLGSSSSSSPPS
jgi:hypothetical protein